MNTTGLRTYQQIHRARRDWASKDHLCTQSDHEANGRMRALGSILLMAVLLPVVVFVAVSVADSMTGLDVLASVIAQATK
jgi:hypothetical protein